MLNAQSATFTYEEKKNWIQDKIQNTEQSFLIHHFVEYSWDKLLK